MKKRSGFLFVLSVFALGMLTACSPPNEIGYEFSWIKTVIPDLGVPLQEDPEWYRVYSLTDEQMDRILAMRFTEQGYSDWKLFSQGFLLSHPSYQLDGYKTPTQVCYKDNGSYKFNPPFNYIAMFVETERKRLILVYGITYGR